MSATVTSAPPLPKAQAKGSPIRPPPTTVTLIRFALSLQPARHECSEGLLECGERAPRSGASPWRSVEHNSAVGRESGCSMHSQPGELDDGQRSGRERG